MRKEGVIPGRVARAVLTLPIVMLTCCLPDPTTDNLLANAVVSNGANTYPLTPPFVPTNYSYSLGPVPDALYTLTLSLSSPKESIISVQENGIPDVIVENICTLTLLANPGTIDTVTMLVSAEDGATMTYTIVITSM